MPETVDEYTQSVYHDPNADVPAPDGAVQYGAEPKDPNAPVSTAGRIVATKDADGNLVLSTPDGGTIEMGNPLAERDARRAAMTSAQRYLEDKRAAAGSIVTAVLIGEETFYIKALPFDEQASIIFSMPVNAAGFIDIGDKKKMAEFAATMMYFGVAQGPDNTLDGNHFFASMEEAREFADEPSVADVVWLLFTKIDELNHLIPKNVRPAGPIQTTSESPDTSTSQ